MTTHQLADVFAQFQRGFGECLKAPVSNGLHEVAAAFRELPDQTLKALVASVQKANTPQPGTTSAIERVRAIREGTVAESEGVDLKGFKKPQFQEILRAFNKAFTGKNSDLEDRIRQLCVRVVPSAQPAGNAASPPAMHIETVEEPDPKAIEEGVRIYSGLRDDRTLTLSDVRAGFEPLRTYAKPVVEEISRRLKVTPFGSRTDILNQLLGNLESVKMSQYRADQIRTGT